MSVLGNFRYQYSTINENWRLILPGHQDRRAVLKVAVSISVFMY